VQHKAFVRPEFLDILIPHKVLSSLELFISELSEYLMSFLVFNYYFLGIFTVYVETRVDAALFDQWVLNPMKVHGIHALNEVVSGSMQAVIYKNNVFFEDCPGEGEEEPWENKVRVIFSVKQLGM
jgi:hypothetical protein